MSTPILAKRPFRAFLSHSHANKAVVDRLYAWLTKTCGYKIWYDAVNFPAGLVGTQLGAAIEECQGAIIVLSTQAIASGWVEQEWNICLEQQAANPDFSIIQLRVDDCALPAALRVRKWIELKDGLTADAAIQIIEAYHGKETSPQSIGQRQIYLSRGNRANEIPLAEAACGALREMSFRIVRDAPDQSTFEIDRVRRIIKGCGGFAAFVPHRGSGATSKYILEEIRVSRELGMPSLIVADKDIDLSRTPLLDPSQVFKMDLSSPDISGLAAALEELVENAVEPVAGSHCFLGHSFRDETVAYWPTAKRALQVATGLPCISGDEVPGGDVQAQIVKRIKEAELCIFDISDDRLNSCIEAGIALGSGARFELISLVPRRRPPFMFRDRQVFFYEDHGDLVGLISRLAHPYRRVVV